MDAGLEQARLKAEGESIGNDMTLIGMGNESSLQVWQYECGNAEKLRNITRL